MKRPLACVALVLLGILIVLRMAIPNLFELQLPSSMEAYEDGETISVVGKIADFSHQTQYQKETTKVVLEDVILLSEHSLEGRKEVLTTSNQSIICYFSEKNEFYIGSQVMISGEVGYFAPATNPGQFDAKTYYGNHRVLFSMKKCRLIKAGKENSRFLQFLYQVRSGCERILDSYLDDGEADIMKAMLLGEKEKLDDETKTLYQKNGIAHILAISGLHISLIGMGIYLILQRLNLPKAVCVFVSVLLLLSYGMMVGLSASTKRAILMFSLIMASKLFKRSYDLLTSLAVAFIVIVLQNPRLIFDCGFQLSFAAILGIGIVLPASVEACEGIETFLCAKCKNAILFSVLSKLKQAFLPSVCVTITTAPILAYHFYEISFLSILLNLLVIPLLTILIGCGVALLLIGFQIPFLGTLLSYVITHILYVYEKSCIIMQSLSIGRVNVAKPGLFAICVYYGILILSTVLVKKKRYRYQFFVYIFSLTFIFFHPSQKFSVWNLDVGQGDCNVIFTQTGHTYIVDCGSTTKQKVGEKILIPFLKSKGINSISGVFVTHPDADHMNGIEELIMLCEQENFDIENLYLYDKMLRADGYSELIEMACDHDVEVQGIGAGSVLRDGELTLSCIYPFSWQENLDGNDASLVLHLQYRNFSGLLTGDLSTVGEEIILRQHQLRNVTWLKLGHHGSSSSSSQAFLEALHPKYVTISCGEDNKSTMGSIQFNDTNSVKVA